MKFTGKPGWGTRPAWEAGGTSESVLLLLCALLLIPAVVWGADITVNSTSDEAATCRGGCGGATCCLREAITAAGADGTISFSVTGTITLAGAPSGKCC